MRAHLYCRLLYTYPRGDIFGWAPRLDIIRALDIDFNLLTMCRYARDFWFPNHEGYDEYCLLSDYVTNNIKIVPDEYWHLDVKLAKEALGRYGLDEDMAIQLAEKELPLCCVDVMEKYDWISWANFVPNNSDTQRVKEELVRFISK